MINALQAMGLRVGRLVTTGASQDVNPILSDKFNFMLLETTDTTGFMIHLRFDGNPASDPAAISVAIPTPGLCFYLVASHPRILKWDTLQGVSVKAFAVTSKTILVTSGMVKSESSGAF